MGDRMGNFDLVCFKIFTTCAYKTRLDFGSYRGARALNLFRLRRLIFKRRIRGVCLSVHLFVSSRYSKLITCFHGKGILQRRIKSKGASHFPDTAIATCDFHFIKMLPEPDTVTYSRFPCSFIWHKFPLESTRRGPLLIVSPSDQPASLSLFAVSLNAA